MKKLIFSSEDLASELSDRARFNRWREIFAWRYGSAEIRGLADRPFKARSEFLQLGTLGLVRSETTVQRFRRTSHQAADGAGGYLVAFNNGLSCTAVDQNGNMEVYSPNQIWLGSAADALDVTIEDGNQMGRLSPCLLQSSLRYVPRADGHGCQAARRDAPGGCAICRRYIGVPADGRRGRRRANGLKRPPGRHAPGSRRAVARRQRGRGGDGRRCADSRAARVPAKFSCQYRGGLLKPYHSPAESVGRALGLSRRAMCRSCVQETGIELPGPSPGTAPAEGPRDAGGPGARQAQDQRSSPLPAGSTRCRTSIAASGAGSEHRRRNLAC